MTKRVPPKPKKLSVTKQNRLHELLDRNSEGTITAAEKKRLQQLVSEAERLMVENAKRLVMFSETQATTPPVAAVPVTVWVKPEHVESESRESEQDSRRCV